MTREDPMEATQVIRTGHRTVAIAAVTLVETLHSLFPGAIVKPSEPYEDEDICLTVYDPWEGEELQHIRQQVYALEFDVYDAYAVEAIVKALPLSYLPESAS
jgi:hypothetical protein